MKHKIAKQSRRGFLSLAGLAMIAFPFVKMPQTVKPKVWLSDGPSYRRGRFGICDLSPHVRVQWPDGHSTWMQPYTCESELFTPNAINEELTIFRHRVVEHLSQEVEIDQRFSKHAVCTEKRRVNEFEGPHFVWEKGWPT